MSLIKCPECKKKVSDKAEICPKCGFKIEGYVPTQEQIDYENDKIKKRKKKIKKYSIITISIIVSLCILCCGIYIGGELLYDYQQEKIAKEEYENNPLFRDSDVLDADPFGLSNENNVIGEKISNFLKFYKENEDYTIHITDDNISYIFPFDSYDYIGSDNKLVLHTSNDIIYEVEYTFRIDNYKSDNILKIGDLKGDITNHYDTDPIYNYIDDNKELQTTNFKTFVNLLYDNYMSLYQISWKSNKGEVILFLTNVYKENREMGCISFTNSNIEIEEKNKRNYVDEYITEL